MRSQTVLFFVLNITLLAQTPVESRPAAVFVGLLNRPDGSGVAVSNACAVDETDREAVESLVRMGSEAIPAIEESLDSGVRRSDVNLGRLAHVYARIQGPAAFPRLLSMRTKATATTAESANYSIFDRFKLDLDQSIALSLGLTSWVPSTTLPIRSICRSQQPRDALNQLIFAWEVATVAGWKRAWDLPVCRRLRPC